MTAAIPQVPVPTASIPKYLSKWLAQSYEKSSAMPNIFGFFKSLGTIFGIIIKVYRNPCDNE